MRADVSFTDSAEENIVAWSKRWALCVDGKIKRTDVRWLPLVARVCLHIGFCTLRRCPDGTPRGGAAPLSGIFFFISILQAMAPAMCVYESARRLLATLRVDAIDAWRLLCRLFPMSIVASWHAMTVRISGSDQVDRVAVEHGLMGGRSRS